MFWWRRQDFRLRDVNTNVCDSPNRKTVFHSKQVIFLSASLFYFLRYSFQYRRNFIRLSDTVYPILQKNSRREYNLFWAMHINVRGFRFVGVGIIYPILGKVLFQILFTNYDNISAHNTGYKWYSWIISPKFFTEIIGHTPPNPVTNLDKSHGAHRTKFRQEMLQRDSPWWQLGQNVLSLNACSYRTGSGHCIRDVPLIWLINTQCRPVFMSTKLVLSRVHVPPARSGQHDAVRFLT